jgi:hypothetical protein
VHVHQPYVQGRRLDAAEGSARLVHVPGVRQGVEGLDRPLPPAPGRCVSIFLDQNRCHIGKSQSKKPPKRTQRPPHQPRRAPLRTEGDLHRASPPLGSLAPPLPPHVAVRAVVRQAAARDDGAVHRLGHQELGWPCLVAFPIQPLFAHAGGSERPLVLVPAPNPSVRITPS